MKRWMLLAAVAVLCAGAPPVMAGGWGVGGFGGITIPIQQEDAANGQVYGLRGRWSPFWSLTIEPQIFLLKNGDYKLTFGDEDELAETLAGWKVTSFGANLVLGAPAGKFTGIRPFFFGGLRLNSMDFPDRDKETKYGFAVGLGLEIGLGPVGLEVRGAGEVIPIDKSSRKNATITGGLNLYLGK